MRHAQQKQDSGVRSPLEKCVMAWRALAMVEIVCVPSQGVWSAGEVSSV